MAGIGKCPFKGRFASGNFYRIRGADNDAHGE
jgi:hypothetical protein